MSKQLDKQLGKMSKEELELYKLRHTAEHILHQAVKELYPNIHLAMGPATEEGFYFDFDSEPESKENVSISEDDFPKIEKRMREIINLDLPLIKKVITPEKAREMFADNPYKLEWIDLIEERGEDVTVYWTGKPDHERSMVDLCSGPHVDSTGEVKAFKLLSIAGAYWHGDEENKMLTRIYGTAFPSEEELQKYLNMLEEAKKRDHRKLGKELELFTISDDVGPGLAIWLPKGNVVREELENWAKETEAEWGYQSVATPHITKEGLYYTSGHLPYYKDDMFPPMQLDDKEENYFLKPMNCPHHHMIYATRPRSYKELPLRLAEYGMCYRYESSGELFGLMRVRGLDINDAHIYCTREQAVEEFIEVMKLHEYYYKTLGIKRYYLEMALRDPKNTDKYHGNEEMWQEAESLMREAVEQVDIEMVEEEGSAAFYGPKIDFIVESSIGREFAVSTNQIDLYMGGRFELTYTDDNGEEQVPAIIHRAPLGSHERFIGFLIEHFAGAFPVWLSPVQAAIIPISEDQLDYATKVGERLKKAGIRFEIDQQGSMQKRIRQAEKQKVPYMLIVGGKEIKDDSVSVRLRGGEDLGAISVKQFVDRAKKHIDQKSLEL